MILKGSQRGHGRNLAAHLLNARDNDHVQVADLRGTAAEDLRGALLEIEATAQGTKCQQPFFQVIINPPEAASLTREQFAAAFDKIEADMGLADHPRAVVFHEKNGREHAHVVYGRLYNSLTHEHGPKAGEERPLPVLKAKQLSFFKSRLREISQELHRDMGLEMPEGLKDSAKRDPLNFDRATWQQAQRIGEDPRDLKKIIGEAFQFADSAKAFNAVLEQNAMQLARGDKRGFVVLHYSGEALPLHRFLGVKQANVRARLGQPEHVQTVDQAREFLKDRMTAQAERQIEELKKAHDKERRPMAQAVRQLKGEQQQARSALVDAQQQRQAQETKERASKIRKGIAGLWDKAQLKFGAGPLARQFAAEIEQSQQRDRTEFHTLKTDQLRDRRQLQKSIRLMQEKQRRERQQARSVLGHWLTLDRDTPRRRMDDHLSQLDTNKEKYMQEREGPKRFRKASDRRKGQERGRGLKLTGPKGPSPKS